MRAESKAVDGDEAVILDDEERMQQEIKSLDSV